jgi:hypothetical protein
MRTLDYYVKSFKQLHQYGRRGEYAPHKPILLLSIIELIEKEEITTPEVECTNKLVVTFNRYWEELAPQNFRKDIATPFFHLKSDSFWELVPRNGAEENLNNRIQSGKPIRTINVLQQLIKCARMNNDLFGYMRDHTGRERLRQTLMQTHFPRKSSQSSENITRKYGPGGEGNVHKELKDWVAQNPIEIGLINVKKTEIEYAFASGDCADIVFELDGNKYVVVEIETREPSPGSLQALKYRVLKCAELGLDIKSPNVEAILVAWSIPKEVRNFCTKYGIRYVEKRL